MKLLKNILAVAGAIFIYYEYEYAHHKLIRKTLKYSRTTGEYTIGNLFKKEPKASHSLEF